MIGNDRSSEDQFIRPTKIVTPPESLIRQTKMLSPFHQRPLLSAKRKPDRIAPVAALLFAWQPYAIVWVVALVWVFALNAVSGAGGFPHVGDEVLELSPAAANANATASVVAEHSISFSPASIMNAFPYSMLESARLAVGWIASVPVEPATPATLRIPAPDVAGGDRYFFAAHATTPIESTPLPSRSPYYSRFVKPDHGQVTGNMTWRNFNRLCHISLSFRIPIIARIALM